MVGTPRILAVTAEPGDESWAFGPVLARYVAEGARVHLVCATSGETGAFGASRGAFPQAVLGRMRERELEAASAALGLHEARPLRLPHGRVASIDPFELQMDLAEHIRRIRPHVILTFGLQGPEGHPDRNALAEATQAAVHTAARHSAPVPGGHAPHAVRKVYQRVWSDGVHSSAEATPGPVAGPALPPATPDWMITTVVGTEDHKASGLKALACHRSRPFAPATPQALPTLVNAAAWWNRAEFVRTLTTVGSTVARENDLLAGIRRGESRTFLAA